MASRKRRVVLIALALVVVIIAIFHKPLLRSTLPKIESAKLAELVIVNDTAFVNLALTIRNKGIWHIDLQYVHLGVYDDTALIIMHESDTLHTINRNDFLKEILYCKIPVENVVERIRLHQGEDTIRLRLKGELVYTTVFGQLVTEVDQYVPVNVPIPPTLDVRRIDYLGKDDGGYDLMFHLTLTNRNPRAMEMKEISYGIVSKDIKMDGYLDNITIAALDSTEILAPAHMNVTNRVGLIAKILLDKDEIDYSFALKGTIVSLTKIVDDDAPVTISKTGHMELYHEDNDNRPKIKFWKKHR
jgi:hypothetical protein